MPDSWMEKPKWTMGRPKARFCAYLALMWSLVAIGGGIMLWQGVDDPELRHLAWFTMAPEPVFIILALFFRLTEVPQKIPAPSDWHEPPTIIH